MNVAFWPTGWDDYRYWQEHDAKLTGKINALIEECRRRPFKGTGNPGPLGGDLPSWWSRRISHEHRLAYRGAGNGVEQVVQCWHHY